VANISVEDVIKTSIRNLFSDLPIKVTSIDVVVYDAKKIEEARRRLVLERELWRNA